MDVIKNKIECNNQINQYINLVAPQIIEILQNTPPKFKVSNELYQATKNLINGVFDTTPNPNDIRCWISTSSYSNSYITIKVSRSYQTSQCGCDYIENTIYVWESNSQIVWEDRPMVSYDEFLDAQNQVKLLNDQIKQLEQQKSNIKNQFYQIFK